MRIAKRLHALNRVWVRAGLRLRLLLLKLRVSQKQRSALDRIACGEAVRDLGERIHDSGMIADGCALIDLGAQQLNEIETGYPAEPRPASWWKHRA